MRSIMQRTVLFFIIAFPVLTAEPALAAPGPADATTDIKSNDQADVLFHKGKASFDAGKVDEAYALYQSAWAIKQTHDIAGNLAQAELKLGKTRDAAEHLAFALAHFPPSLQSDRRDGLKKVLDGLRQQLGVLHIKLSVTEAKVTMDGRVLGAAQPLDEVFVGVGSHTVVAELPGYTTATTTVQATAGSSQDVNLVLVKPAPVPEGEPPKKTREDPKPPVASAGPSPLLILASGVLGVAGVAAGIGLTAAANGKSTDADALGAKLPGSACAGTPAAAFAADCTALSSTLGEQSTRRNAAFVSFAAGGAFALVAVGLGVWKLKSPATTSKLHIAPVVGVRDGGVVLGGVW